MLQVCVYKDTRGHIIMFAFQIHSVPGIRYFYPVYLDTISTGRKYPTKGVHPPTSVQIPHSEKKPNGNSSAKAEMGHSWRWTLVGRYFLVTFTLRIV